MKNLKEDSISDGVTDDQIASDSYTRLSTSLPTSATWVTIWKSVNMNVANETWLTIAAVSQRNL